MRNTLKSLFLAGLISTTTLIWSEVQAKNLLLSSLGVIVGTPVGAVSGAMRGALSKGVVYSNNINEKLNVGLAGNLVAVPLGLISGFTLGSVSGLAKGAIDGVHYGYEQPFTLKSLSLNGELLDFDPYAISLDH